MKDRRRATTTLARGETVLRDGGRLPFEVQQLVLEAGYDPREVFEEIADWYERQVVIVSDAA
jgi:hypothetical protein